MRNCICLSYKIYLSRGYYPYQSNLHSFQQPPYCQIKIFAYLSMIWNVFVQMIDCICLNYKIYLYKGHYLSQSNLHPFQQPPYCQIVFVQYMICICSNDKFYLSKLQNIFVQGLVSHRPTSILSSNLPLSNQKLYLFK